MKSTVVYISSCGLDAQGAPDPFFLQELPWLRTHFDQIFVCSAFGIAAVTQTRPTKILPNKPAYKSLTAWLKAPFCRQFWQEIKHLQLENKLHVNSIIKLLLFTVRGLTMYSWIQSVIGNQEQVTVYAYWMSYDGFAAALCKQKNASIRAIARGHAFDIDIQRNAMNPYLMKRFMAQTLDAIYPINQTAKSQILAYADVPAYKLRVVGVGSVGEKAETHHCAPRFQDGVFRVISCSAIVAIKQIPLMIDALANWNISKLHWVHIGSGPDAAMVREYAREKLANQPYVTYKLMGNLPPEQVRSLYAVNAFDVFLNTSQNEGTPVSIMEALHEGIPVIAPAVGGIVELVDDTIGCLYPPNGTAQDIMNALMTIHAKPAQAAEAMSKDAQKRWNERCLISGQLPKLFATNPEEGQTNG